jgi:hypothetical protein
MRFILFCAMFAVPSFGLIFIGRGWQKASRGMENQDSISGPEKTKGDEPKSSLDREIDGF